MSDGWARKTNKQMHEGTEGGGATPPQGGRARHPRMHAARMRADRDQDAAEASDNCCCVSLSLSAKKPCAAWPPVSLSS